MQGALFTVGPGSSADDRGFSDGGSNDWRPEIHQGWRAISDYLNKWGRPGGMWETKSGNDLEESGGSFFFEMQGNQHSVKETQVQE